MAPARHEIVHEGPWIVLLTTRQVRGETKVFRSKFRREDLETVVPMLTAELALPLRPEEQARMPGSSGGGYRGPRAGVT
jgi:hypothetical protein